MPEPSPTMIAQRIRHFLSEEDWQFAAHERPVLPGSPGSPAAPETPPDRLCADRHPARPDGRLRQRPDQRQHLHAAGRARARSGGDRVAADRLRHDQRQHKPADDQVPCAVRPAPVRDDLPDPLRADHARASVRPRLRDRDCRPRDQRDGGRRAEQPVPLLRDAVAPREMAVEGGRARHWHTAMRDAARTAVLAGPAGDVAVADLVPVRTRPCAALARGCRRPPPPANDTQQGVRAARLPDVRAVRRIDRAVRRGARARPDRVVDQRAMDRLGADRGDPDVRRRDRRRASPRQPAAQHALARQR